MILYQFEFLKKILGAWLGVSIGDRTCVDRKFFFDSPFGVLVSFIFSIFCSFSMVACNPLGKTTIGTEFHPGIEISYAKSEVSVNNYQVAAGNQVLISFRLKDQSGNSYVSVLPDVQFSVSGGTSIGVLGPVINNNDGSYSATFTGIVAGSPLTVGVSVNGLRITGVLPTVQVVVGSFSLSDSIINISSSSVLSADSITVILTVKDSSGNQLSDGGLHVGFSTSGGTSTGVFSAVTDNHDGTYSTTFTGLTAGTATTLSATIQTMEVTSPLPTLTVFVGNPTSIAIISGSGQSGTAGNGLGAAFVVAVKDINNNLVPGAVVDWSVTGGGGVLSSASTTTSASGQASNALTLGAVSGANTVTATIHGTGVGTSFTATGNPGAGASIEISSGNAQSGTAGYGLGAAFVVAVKDINNNLVPGAVVDWSVTGGGGVLSSASTTTSASGQASNALTLGAVSGANTVTATIHGTGVGTSFTATGNPGAGASIEISSGNAQSGTAGYGLGAAFVVAVKDINNNLVPGTVVDWSVTGGGGVLSSASTTTNASGQTSNTLTAGLTPGINSISAVIHGTAINVSFSATAVLTAFTSNWVFDSLNANTLYSYNSNKIDFTGGVVRLLPAPQTDSDGSSAGFGGGTLVGLGWDSTNLVMRLNTSTNNSELDSSWTPHWSNLVAYWKMNNDWNDSVGSNHLSPVNGPTFTSSSSSSAKVGAYAASFDGTSQYATLADNSSFQFGSEDFSFSYWYYPNAGCTGWSNGWGIGQWNTGSSPGTNQWAVGNCNAVGNVNNFSFGFESGATTYSVFSTGTYSVGTWYHLAGSRIGNSIYFYVNGLLQGTALVNSVSVNSIGRNFRVARADSSTTPTNARFDDIAIWKGYGLTASDVGLIYSRQSAKYSGQITSRIMDAFDSSQNWSSMSLTSRLPFYKELPASTSGESSASYSSLVSNLTSGLVGFWHLNETSGTTLVDASGNGRNGTTSGTPTLGAQGVLGTGVGFNGTSQSASLSSIDLSATKTVTFAFWLNQQTESMGAVSWATVIEHSSNFNLNNAFILAARDCTGAPKVPCNATTICMRSNTGSTYNIKYLYPGIPLGWSHIVVTWDRSVTPNQSFLWINGAPQTLTPSGNAAHSYNSTSNFGNFPIYLMSRGGSLGRNKGILDELGIWSRKLSSSEVIELYRRGANRLKYQVRTCSAADCSDQDALTNSYKGWKGPDNTGLTYFSELYNTTDNISNGSVLPGSALLTFSKFSGTGLSVNSSRYFQYRSIFESDDVNNLCTYGEVSASCSPELKSVDIGPTHYDKSIPTVYNTEGVSFYELTNFVQTLGGNGCNGTIGYNLSLDKSTWYYWTGSVWQVSDGTYAQSNPASSFNGVVLSYFATQVGRGTVYFKAYLKSDGIHSCELDNIQIDGSN